MRIISIVALILSLMACQQSEDQSQTPEKTEKEVVAKTPTPTKTNETLPADKSEVKKDFSLLTELPYDTIESDEVCTAPVVIEFFAYQCPHCYTLETFAAAWKKQNAGKIQFRPVPTDLGNKAFGSFLIVHQAAKKLGLLDLAMPALFNRLHEQKKAFSSPDDALEFLVSLGASQQDAKKTLDDQEAMKAAIAEDYRLLSKYKIAGVPTILVNHRYQFNVTKAGGYDNVFKVVEETLKLSSSCTEQ